MDTGCPSFIPEPENHEKPRVAPPQESGAKGAERPARCQKLPIFGPTLITAAQLYWKTISPPTMT